MSALKTLLILCLTPLVSFATAEDVEYFDILFQSNSGSLVALEAFLSHGGKPSSTNKTGYTLLQTAILNGNTEAVRLLLNYEAEVNTDYPATPTNGKASSQKVAFLIKITDKVFTIPLEIVNLLLQNGLNVSVTDHQGNTALMRAIQLLHQWPDKSYRNNFIKLLVRYKVDINTQNHKEDTALHIASKIGDLETVRVLIKAKARLDLTNKEGMIPIQMAKAMSGNIPPTNADLKWYWYFSFFGKNHKIIRLLQEAETQNGSTVHSNSRRSCRKSFI